MEITYQIEGVDKLLEKLETKELLGQALRDIFTKSTLTIQREVQTRTKADTARLRSSITTEVDSAAVPQWGKVGTDVAYAPFVEYDTRPHFPPLAAITPWAHRHGMNPFLVALGISKHGTKGAHMFELGLEASKDKLNDIIENVADDIEERFGK